MRKLTVAFLLALTSLVADAQEDRVVIEAYKTVACSSVKNMIEFVSGEYQEIPQWSGVGTATKFILMVNKKSGTWTMIEYNDDLACMIAHGARSTVINFGKIKS